MSKKILLTLGILVIIALAVFWVLNRNTTSQIQDGNNGFSIRDFLPFGSGNNNVTIDTNSTSTNSTNEPILPTSNDIVVPKLRKLSSEPVAGAIMFNRSTSTIVRFVEKGTGNVYEANSSTTAITRLTNTTIPKIIRAFWLPDGSGFLSQTLDTYTELIETSFVKISNIRASSTAENLTPYTTSISKLPIGISEIAVSRDGRKIIYYVTSTNGAVWYVSNPDGTSAIQVFSTPLTEWLIKSFDGKKAVVQTKSSSAYNGYIYNLDTASKTMIKIGTGLAGLSITPDYDMSPLLTSSGGYVPTLSVMNEKNGVYSNINTNTLAEKCVWTKTKAVSIYCGIPSGIPAGEYPDDWYKGKIFTTDIIRKIDYVNDINKNIIDLKSETDQNIDVVNPQISENDAYLIFRNKIDGFLWMLNLK